MSIHAFDLNADGVVELITGWSNGKVRARLNGLLHSKRIGAFDSFTPFLSDRRTKRPHRRGHLQRQLLLLCSRSGGGRLQAGRAETAHLCLHRWGGWVLFTCSFICGRSHTKPQQTTTPVSYSTRLSACQQGPEGEPDGLQRRAGPGPRAQPAPTEPVARASQL